MSKKLLLFLVVLLFALGGRPVLAAEADPKSPATPLQAFLASSAPVIDGYELNAEELRRFYALRNFQPVWDTNPKGDRASLKSFLSSVTAYAAYHGLPEENYPSNQLTKLIAGTQQEADSTKIELLVTAWLLRLAHDLHGDSVNLAHLYPGWKFEPKQIDVVAGLEKAVQDNRVYDFIAELAPTGPEYLHLARELKVYREMAAKGPWPTVAPGPKLLPGDHDPRTAQVRARLEAEKYIAAAASLGNGTDLFDEELRGAVENYQARNGLKPDGHIGEKTLAAMNTPIAERIGQIIANMERWRHMPEKFPSRYAMVNIAAAQVEIMDDSKSLYRGPVVVGRPDRKTPFIQSSIRSVIFNPYWHVPTKIARKDILPKLRRDPHYLEKMGLVINGSADDPYGKEIDWDSVRESAFNYQLRQSPGELNSLGRLKFDFDNDFSVYMHGTPHQELFEKAERNQSSGCVRLRDPDVFAEILLAHNEGGWSVERIHEEIDKRTTHWLRITEPLPLYFVYWSVFPADDDGPMNFRSDVYNYDQFLLETMHKSGPMESQNTKGVRHNPLI